MVSLHALQKKIENLIKRDKLLRIIRNFFYERDFVEIDSPILVPSPGMEPHLDPFIAKGKESKKMFYLPTSPEFYLKKVLACGLKKVFSISHSFRDEAETESNSCEFTMLEWYRKNEPIESIIKDCEEILKVVSEKFLKKKRITLKGKTIKFSEGIYFIELNEFFREITGYRFTELQGKEQWLEVGKGFYRDMNSSWSENDIFSYLMAFVVEEELKKFDKPLILFGYPKFQCALARIENDIARRFELFIGGVEIANAYDELVGKSENLKRYHLFQKERKAMKKQLHPKDELFFEAVEEIKSCSGIAFGLDRFLALLLNCEIIEVQNRV